ncbi:MAG TPA: aminoglycoside phosphotransferase family protein [Candidatus Dormibacteraeota bacterium]|nr:aminoglycoside phosphotransferase family protein [Candidatus Dormibacteraeota bacterium]
MTESTLPASVVHRVLEWHGDRGREWLDRLPRLVSRIADAWELEVGAALEGGTHSFVAPVQRSDGSPAIIKVPFVDDENRSEAEALRLYAGQGAVLLYEFDAVSGAMLLELAEPGSPLSRYGDRSAAIDIACKTLARLRRPVPSSHPFLLVRDKAAEWKARFGLSDARLHSQRLAVLLARAQSALARLEAEDAASLLVNRDAHLDNVLAATREPWLLIDPKPLVGDPAFDAGYLISDLLGDDRDPRAAERLMNQVSEGLAEPRWRVAAWGVARAAENAVWVLEDLAHPVEAEYYVTLGEALLIASGSELE